MCVYPPECLFIFPCQWNYRPDHCMYGSNCRGAEKDGVSILHGNRGVYHDDKQPAFKVVYDAIHEVSGRRGGDESDLMASGASVCVPAVSLRGQHVPLALLPHTVQVPGHRQHPVWTDPSSLPQADRKDSEEGFRGEGGPTRQAAQVRRRREENRRGCSEAQQSQPFRGAAVCFWRLKFPPVVRLRVLHRERRNAPVGKEFCYFGSGIRSFVS